MMNFAVIEYTSKTGKVWAHTPKKPNYLCDPVKEIDPTSFGCYVSALKGEHIPLTGMIIGDIANVSKTVKLYRKIRKRLTGSWPQKYNISYLEQFDALMIVHQISDGEEITKFTKRIKKKYPEIKILGVPTQPYGILKDHWKNNPQWLQSFKEFMNTCDVFITIVKSTKDIWQNMTATKVEYIPQPYPVEHAVQKFTPYEKKEKIIFVAGVTERDNILKGHIVAKKLQEKLPEFTIHVTKIHDHELDTSQLEESSYKIVPFQLWQQHLEYLSKTALVINTDYTQTRGRVQVDCAAVGTPSIGTDSDGQVDLFPNLPANRNTDIQKLIEQGEKLLTNKMHYISTATTAKNNLQKYNYTQSAKRISDLINSI